MRQTKFIYPAICRVWIMFIWLTILHLILYGFLVLSEPHPNQISFGLTVPQLIWQTLADFDNLLRLFTPINEFSWLILSPLFGLTVMFITVLAVLHGDKVLGLLGVFPTWSKILINLLYLALLTLAITFLIHIYFVPSFAFLYPTIDLQLIQYTK